MRSVAFVLVHLLGSIRAIHALRLPVERLPEQTVENRTQGHFTVSIGARKVEGEYLLSGCIRTSPGVHFVIQSGAHKTLIREMTFSR